VNCKIRKFETDFTRRVRIRYGNYIHFGPWSLRSFLKGPKCPGTELTKNRSALTTSAVGTNLSTAKNTTPKDNKGRLWGWFVTGQSCVWYV